MTIDEERIRRQPSTVLANLPDARIGKSAGSSMTSSSTELPNLTCGGCSHFTVMTAPGNLNPKANIF